MAENSTLLIDRLIAEFAEKPENHAAIARYYREKAMEARQEVAQHQAMRKSYSLAASNPKKPVNVTNMKAHCNRLIAQHEDIVKEYVHMAEEQEKLVK